MSVELSYMCVPGIKNEYRRECAPVISPDRIITIVCNHLNVNVDHVKSKTRVKEYVYARHVTFYFLRKFTKLSLKTIGDMLNRDHTTVIHGLENLSDIMDTEQDVRLEVELLERRIHGRE